MKSDGANKILNIQSKLQSSNEEKIARFYYPDLLSCPLFYDMSGALSYLEIPSSNFAVLSVRR